MTLKGGTSQACAACKYQRRKCTSDCPLAPYFPPDQPKMFQNAHRLFGVSNILKILKQIDPSQKMEAMRSIIYQANIRDRLPVHGCCGVIFQLNYQIQQVEEELHAVQAQLALYRHQHQHQHQQDMSSSIPLPSDSTSHLQLGMAPPNNALSLFQDASQPYTNALPITSPPALSYSNPNHNSLPFNPTYIDSKENNSNNNSSALNSFWVQHNTNANTNPTPNPNQMAMAMAMQSQQPLSIQQETAQEYDELHPFFDTIDDRQSYIDSKEAYDSSSESSLKDTNQSNIEHVAENELKSAAACFSLTSVN